jgi:hypothetical protein
VKKALIAVALAAATTVAAAAKPVHHYVYFGRQRERIRAATFLNAARIEGAQLRYAWRELEPEKDKYDFSSIESDFDFLTAHHKRLFIQLQDVSLYSNIINVPRYLETDGIAPQSDDSGKPAGWVARRWDPAVQQRFHRLLSALGKQFDGRIEGINLPETSLVFGKQDPSGFTPEKYRNAIIENMEALKAAFPRSVAMQYANFMPGEWLPWEDKSYLTSVYQRARAMHVAVGGPDVLPYRRGQMNHAYKLIRENAGAMTTGIAVQEGNYAYKNPQTGKRVTSRELLTFATDYLGVDYIFWCDEEPYYSRDVLPMLAQLP